MIWKQEIEVLLHSLAAAFGLLTLRSLHSVSSDGLAPGVHSWPVSTGRLLVSVLSFGGSGTLKRNIGAISPKGQFILNRRVLTSAASFVGR